MNVGNFREGGAGIGAWMRRRLKAMTSKPDRETELPESRETMAEEQMAIEGERERRITDKQDDEAREIEG